MLLVSTTKPATAKILPKPEQEPGPQVGEAGTWNWGAPAGFVEMVTSRWHGRVVVEWNTELARTHLKVKERISPQTRVSLDPGTLSWLLLLPPLSRWHYVRAALADRADWITLHQESLYLPDRSGK